MPATRHFHIHSIKALSALLFPLALAVCLLLPSFPARAGQPVYTTFNSVFTWDRDPSLSGLTVDNSWHYLNNNDSNPFNDGRFRFNVSASHPFKASLRFSFPIALVVKYDPDQVKAGQTLEVFIKAVPKDGNGKEFISACGPNMSLDVQGKNPFGGWTGKSFGFMPDLSINLQADAKAPFQGEQFVVNDTISFVDFTELLLSGGGEIASLTTKEILKAILSATVEEIGLFSIDLVAAMKVKGVRLAGEAWSYGAGTFNTNTFNIYNAAQSEDQDVALEWATLDVPIPANARTGDRISLNLSLEYVLDFWYSAGASANILGNSFAIYGDNIDAMDETTVQNNTVGDLLGWKGPQRLEVPRASGDRELNLSLVVAQGAPAAQPAGTASVLINDGDTYTGFPDVTLSLQYPEGAHRMRCGIDSANVDNSPLEPLQQTKAVTLKRYDGSQNSGSYTVYVAFYDDYGNLITNVHDAINLNRSQAALNSLPPCEGTTAFDAEATANNNVSRLGLLCRETGQEAWNLLTVQETPSTSTLYKFPVQIADSSPRQFALRVWDSNYNSRDFTAPGQIQSTTVLPHGLRVRVDVLNFDSVRLHILDNCSQIIAWYNLYLSDDQATLFNPNDVTANQVLAVVADFSQWVDLMPQQTVVNGLKPNTLYYYKLRAKPKSTADPYEVDGTFITPGPGDYLEVGYSVTGPDSITVTWNNLGTVPTLTKYRLVVYKTSGDQAAQTFDIAGLSRTSQDVSGLIPGVRYAVWMECYREQDAGPFSQTLPFYFTLEGPKPDLRVSEVQVSNPQPSEGEMVTVTATVTNAGEAPAPAFQVAVQNQLSNGKISNCQEQMFQCSGLEVGQSIQVSGQCLAHTPGSLNLGFMADAQSQVYETNEENNAAFAPVEVMPPRPDLTIAEVISTSQPRAGNVLHLKPNLVNQGEAAAATCIVRLLARSPEGETITVSNLSTGKTQIAPDQSQQLVFEHTPSSAGAWRYEFVVDPDNALTESNEGNNTKWFEVLVSEPASQETTGSGQAEQTTAGSGQAAQPQEPAKPNLVPSKLTCSPESPKVGDVLRFKFSFTNNGAANAGPLKVAMMDGSTVLDIKTISGQTAPGKRKDLMFSFAPTTAGQYTFRFIVDCEKQIAESNENDNTKVIPITMAAAAQPQAGASGQAQQPQLGGHAGQGAAQAEEAKQPNLALYPNSLKCSPKNPKVGDKLRFKLRFTNKGNAKAGPLQVAMLVGERPEDSKAISGQTAPGKHKDLMFEFVPTTAGQYNFRFIVDSENKVAESNEHDNDQIIKITVAAAAQAQAQASGHALQQQPSGQASSSQSSGGLADLTIPRITRQPTSARAGDTIVFKVFVQNKGAAKSPPPVVEFSLGGKSLERKTLSKPIPKDKTGTVEFQYQTSKAARLRFTFVVDPDKKLPEKNEKNNSMTQTLTIRPAKE